MVGKLRNWLESPKSVIDYYQIKHIVITGGEPFLQMDKIIEFINIFDKTHTFEFETNGTIDYSPIKHRLNCFSTYHQSYSSIIKYMFIIVRESTINLFMAEQMKYQKE